ncbi:MAG: protein kinase [Planctomycetaceae bacterium]
MTNSPLQPDEPDLVSEASVSKSQKKDRSQRPADPALAETELGGGAVETSQGPQRENRRDEQSFTPKRFGRYQLLKLLGQGGMGAVYLAEDTELQRRVALKLPKIKGDSAGEMLDRFRREARTAATLTHPNICPVYEFGEIDGQFFLTMAYVDGQPLSYYTKKTKAIAARQAALLVRKLALALAHAHEKGIIHRDIKPANVMIDKSAEPIVMDFGLARRESSDDTRLTQTGTFVGTPAYVSPEQITNKKGEVDQRTDIYSLGVMLYEMLAKRLPFEAESALSMMAQVLTGTPEFPGIHRDRACPRLSEIAMKAISRDVTLRYQTMQELADDLTAYLKGDTQPRSANESGVESTSASNSGSNGDMEETAALNAEHIDFLNFDLKEYDFGESLKPSNRKSSASGTQSRRRATENSPSKTKVQAAGRRSKGTRQVGDEINGRGGGNSRILTAAGFAFAFVLVLGVILTIRTKHGSVRLDITGNPDDVEISVDGETISLEVAEQGYQIEVGEHSMIVKADGFETDTRKFVVDKGKVRVEVVQMKKLKGEGSGGSGTSEPPAPVTEPDLTTTDEAFLGMIDPNSKWTWLPPEPLGAPFETDKKDSCITISGNGLAIVYRSERNGLRGAFLSRRATLDSQWGDAVPIHEESKLNDIWSYYLNDDGTYLIGTSNDGTAGSDGLWYSAIDKSNGQWQRPQKLGMAGYQYGQYPYVSPDGTELFFQSNDGQSYFCARSTSTDVWSSPTRIRDHSSALDLVPFESVGIVSSDGKAALLFPDPIIVFREGKGKPWRNPKRVEGFPKMFPPSYSPDAKVIVFDYRHSKPELGMMRLVPRSATAPNHDPETETLQVVDSLSTSAPTSSLASSKDPFQSRTSDGQTFSYSEPQQLEGEIDLLKTVDLRDCLIEGKASFDGLILRLGDPGTWASKIEFPIVLPKSFRLDLVLERTSEKGGFVISVPFGIDKSAEIVIDGQMGSGIQRIDGLLHFDNETQVDGRTVMDDRQPHTITLDVKEDSFEVMLDGSPFTSFHGDSARVRGTDYSPLNRAGLMLSSVYHEQFRIKQFTATLKNQTATKQLPAKIVTEEAIKAAEKLHGPALRELIATLPTDKSRLTTRSAYESPTQVLFINHGKVVDFTPEIMSAVTKLLGPVFLDLYRMNPDPAATSVEHFEGLGRMPNLVELDLYNRHFVDTARLKCLAQSKTLESLVVDHQGMSDEEIEALCALKNLRFLRMHSVGMNDRRLQLVAKSLVKLRFLVIGGWGADEQISSTSIEMFEKLHDLRLLDFSHCAGITDELVPALGKLKWLKFLSIEATSITEAGFKKLQQLLPDTEIKWSSR